MINKIFLGFTATTYGCLGGWALFDPSSYVTAVGLTINTDLGSAEIRAVYGGINFLVGKIFPLAIPPKSGTKHSTSVIELSFSHFSKFSFIGIIKGCILE